MTDLTILDGKDSWSEAWSVLKDLDPQTQNDLFMAKLLHFSDSEAYTALMDKEDLPLPAFLLGRIGEVHTQFYMIADITCPLLSTPLRNPFNPNFQCALVVRFCDFENCIGAPDENLSGTDVLFLPRLHEEPCGRWPFEASAIYTLDYLGVDAHADPCTQLQQLLDHGLDKMENGKALRLQVQRYLSHLLEEKLNTLTASCNEMEARAAQQEQRLSEGSHQLEVQESIRRDEEQSMELLAQKEAKLQERIHEAEGKQQYLSARVKVLLGCLPVEETDAPEEPSIVVPTTQAVLDRLEYRYSPEPVTAFLTALGTDQPIILFGRPGTGKTTFVSAMAKALGARLTMIGVQNNWTDSLDLMGYYDPNHSAYVSTDFTEALLLAQRDYLDLKEDAPLHIICLDEMNLSRVEYYFATFLNLLPLPQRDRRLSLLPIHVRKEELSPQLAPYQNFLLPPNVRFVGTINHDDTACDLSPKVIDRCFFLELKDDFSQPVEKEIAEYYPVSCFTPNGKQEDMPAELLDLFSGENNRFRYFLSQMWNMYTQLGEQDQAAFRELLIRCKLLPAAYTPRQVARLKDAYCQKEDHTGEDPELTARYFDPARMTDGFFDYLGGEA